MNELALYELRDFTVVVSPMAVMRAPDAASLVGGENKTPEICIGGWGGSFALSYQACIVRGDRFSPTDLLGNILSGC